MKNEIGKTIIQNVLTTFSKQAFINAWAGTVMGPKRGASYTPLPLKVYNQKTKKTVGETLFQKVSEE